MMHSGQIPPFRLPPSAQPARPEGITRDDTVHGETYYPRETLVQQLQREIARLRRALKFYAHKGHFMLSDEGAWDTVSDEPQNLWCDLAGTATVEDGFFARAALAVTIAASQTPPDHNRAAFEHRMGGANFKRDANGNYVNEFVRCKWWGWCAHADEVREIGVKP